MGSKERLKDTEVTEAQHEMEILESLDQLIHRIAGNFGVTVDDLKSSSKQRRVSEARSVLCYLAVRKLGYSCAEVSRSLNISPSTVSVGVQRGKNVKGLQGVQSIVLCKE